MSVARRTSPGFTRLGLRAGVVLGLMLAALAHPPAGAVAQEAAPAPPAPDSEEPPRVVASLDTTATTVGGRLTLTLEVEPAAGWRVAPPEKSLDLESFRVRSVERLPRPEGEAFRIAIVPLEAGETEIPSIALTAHGPGGAKEEIATEPLPVTVRSNLPAPAAEDRGAVGPGPVGPRAGGPGAGGPGAGSGPPGVASPGMPGGASPGGGAVPGDPAAAPEPADLKPLLDAPRDWLPLLVGFAAFALALAAGIWLLRKLRAREAPAPGQPAAPRAPLRPAWEIALEELDRIAEANFVGRGELSRQYVEVTEALRRYLENRYGVPALECTTDDLTKLLRSTPVGPDTGSRILSLLREADLVKFAKASPEPGAARATEQRARALVEETIPEAAPTGAIGGSPRPGAPPRTPEPSGTVGAAGTGGVAR